MNTTDKIDDFLSQYSEAVYLNASLVRTMLLEQLPEVQEQLDIPAKMVGYCYGQKYIELVCMLIPSQKGLKLSFYNGVNLPDPDKLLQGKGKISRYVEIKSADEIYSQPLKTLIQEALKAYRERIYL